ncbi:hypothetical protein D9Q81_03670 [Candidatus Korarchaeum cryptofilum]|jgi:hypothetical protein|uniref:Uncharacterized protein n=1 Tax=Candidatus Korarchaeum cryptofilum TaxID=498846 RepID=A0A3R9QSS0_9CREN|nr:hypothetical protein [Candidatus Korarchaeum cryptofilum]RSN69705.1 hypothetical protein D9Q81_03670 [Candidatus Korarchaeum cryptofilum]
MILSIEKVLLTLIGLATIIAILPAINQGMAQVAGERDQNCLNVAARAVDLAITNSIGGGVASSYVFLPVKVVYRCENGAVYLEAGNSSVSLSYPFQLSCEGEAYLYGRFVASWRRSADGFAVAELRWSDGGRH